MKRLLLLNVFLFFTIIINAQGWGEIQKIVPYDRAIGDKFGYSVAMYGDYLIISAQNKATTSSSNGAVYVYKHDINGNWNQEQILTQSNIRQFDQFGNSVAMDGDYLIVGCRGQDYDENDNNYINGAPGAAYIFEKDGNGTWNQAQKLVATNRTSLDVFGDSVDISGNYAIVSAPWEDEDANEMNTLAYAGSAFIFERDAGGVWQRVQKIVASDRSEKVEFGDKAVAIDGNFIAVGVWRQFSDATGGNILSGAGAVYLFERDNNGNWNEVQKIVASDREQGEWFGRSVDISGNTLIVGASKEYLTGNTNTQYGAAYIFERNGSGVWNEVQKIKPDYLVHQSKFGQSVSIDGDNIIIGAYRVDIGSAADGGAAFIFNKDGLGVWNQVASIYDDDASTSDNFGFDVAIRGDNAVVGAQQEDEDELGLNFMQEAGSTYIFNVNEQNTLDPLNTLSVTNNNLKDSINTYPNPVKDILNVDLLGYYQNVDVNVYNSLGQLICKENYKNSNGFQLHLNVAHGLYLVEIETENQLSTLRIVKH